ncbi:alpha-1-3-mannosyltransferase [Kluyveromyces marxianus]|uniref:Alpha-1-3-mannosyltransferase n=1 Tax=Kluyveromyces marxianus TaxID=4911 RepID=A0ABX6F3B5_KLUMA|nr:alpha-1-3-mannosyltransferase [Kluyveromyces marxianus]
MTIRRLISSGSRTRTRTRTRTHLGWVRYRYVMYGFVITCIGTLVYLLVERTGMDVEKWHRAARMADKMLESYSWDLISDAKIKAIEEIPVSPLELIPDIELNTKKRYDASWDLLFRGRKYKSFSEYDLSTKCEFYFQNLYNLDEEWTNEIGMFTFDIKDIKSDSRMSELKDDDGVKLIDEKALRYYKRKHNIALGMERLRIYDRCFVGNNNNKHDSIKMNELFEQGGSEGSTSTASKLDKTVIGNKDSLRPTRKASFLSELDSGKFSKFNQWDFEHRMFPFISYFEQHNFTQVMPIFTGPGSHQPLPQGKFPVFNRDTGELSTVESFNYDETKSLWDNWNDLSARCSHKGIVMSAGNGQVDQTIRLIAVLREQQNRMPIQIIHNDQLSDDSVALLSEAAQSTNFSNGPKQSVWFLNVKPTLSESEKGRFDRFKNKWLSVIFNTFEEFIFIDSDAISYIGLEEYFKFDEYSDTGTLMFKDRSLKFGAEQKCPVLFETLQPKILERYYFDTLPQINAEFVEQACMKELTPEEKVYKRFFELGQQHHLESGLLAINKRQHIMSMIISTVLNISPKIGGCAWGDKEFFWLGLLVSGHRYSIYDVAASAVGIPSMKERERDDELKEAQEICSTQVGHTSYDKHLLWINGGSQLCKFEGTFDSDWEQFENIRKEFHDNKDKARQAYKDVMPIEAAIIPDINVGRWAHKDRRCSGYVWCGEYFEKIKPYTYSKKIVKGELIHFDQKEIEHIRHLNTIWNKASLLPTDNKE